MGAKEQSLPSGEDQNTNQEPGARLIGYTTYEMVTKDNTGEAQIHTLTARRYAVEPSANLPDYLTPAEPVIIQPVEISANEESESEDTVERILVLPDIQAGFRQYEDGSLEPIHSEEAIDVALQIVRDCQPHQVILNGDNVDFTTLSKHLTEPAFAGSLRPTFNYVHQLLARIRANAPLARIVYLAGNHEQRLEKYLMSKAPELLQLRQAGNAEPILAVPFLLNFNAIGNVEYLAGYPAGSHWLSDDIRAVHGHKVRQGGGATAAAVLKAEDSSNLFGHIHRIELAYRTMASRYGGKIIVAASFGCLANIEGRVPSYGSAVDSYGRPVRHIEDWQNGLGYLEVCRRTGRLALLHPVVIDTFHPTTPYATRFNGKTYLPNNRKYVATEEAA